MSRESPVPLNDALLSDALFERLPGLAWLIDESGRFVRYNRGFRQLMGISDEALGELNAIDVAVPRDQPRVRAAIQEILAGHEVNLRCSLRVGEKEIPIEGTGMLMTVGGRRLIFGFANDISMQLASASALRRSDLKYEAVFNATHDAIVIHGQDGRVLDVNERWCSMIGCTREDALATGGSHLAFLESPYSQAEAFERIRLASQVGPQVFEWPCRRVNGEHFWAEVALRAATIADESCVVAAVRDISERKQSEACFRQLFDGAADAIFLHDSGGRILNANQVACTSLGYTREELVGLHISDIEVGVGAADLARIWATVLSEKRFEIEGVQRRKDGTTFPVEVHVVPFYVEDGTIFFASTRDISQRRRAEAALREQERRYALAVSASADAIWELNVATGAIYYSPRWYEILGYPDQQMPMSLDSWQNLCHPEDYPRVMQRVQTSINDPANSRYDVEFRLRRADGTWAWLRSRGAVVARDQAGKALLLCGTNSDITERRKSEQEILEQKHRYDLLARAAAQIVYDCAMDGSIVWGDAMTTALGYGPDEVEGGQAQWAERIHPDEREQVVRQYDAAAAGGLAFKAEYQFRHKNGEYRWIKDTGYPLFDAQGELQRYVGIMADVTAQKHAQAERRRLEESLRHSQKMESIGRLAGGVAHDFNNLLTAISGNLALAMLGDSTQAVTDDLLFEAARAAESAANLTRQLLTFSRKQVIHPKVLCLNDTIHGVQKMLRRLLGEDVELAVELADDLGLVESDEGQLEQVLVNLAVNARDAMPDGGRLVLQTANANIGSDATGGSGPLQPGQYVLLTVSDSGTGMSPEVQEHLFEPFFTTKEAGKGTGFGLALVYSAVQQNRGHIVVDSQLGRGTRIFVYLPRVEATPPRAGERNSFELVAGAESILVVEDEVQVRTLAVRILERQGYRVHAFGNGTDALLALSHPDLVVDLILTDVVMPGMNGRVFSERAQQLRPSLPVLFTSGYTDDIIVQHGVNEHGVDFIAKPYTVEELTRRIRDMLDRASAKANS